MVLLADDLAFARAAEEKLSTNQSLQTAITISKMLHNKFGAAKGGAILDILDFNTRGNESIINVKHTIMKIVNNHHIARLAPERSVIVWLKAAAAARKLHGMSIRTSMIKNDLFYMTAVQLYKKMRLSNPGRNKYFRPRIEHQPGWLGRAYNKLGHARHFRLRHEFGPTLAECIRITRRQPHQDAFVWARAANDVLQTSRPKPHFQTPELFIAAVNRRYDKLMDVVRRKQWLRVAIQLSRYQERRVREGLAKNASFVPMAGLLPRLPAHLMFGNIADFVGPSKSHSAGSSQIGSKLRNISVSGKPGMTSALRTSPTRRRTKSTAAARQRKSSSRSKRRAKSH